MAALAARFVTGGDYAPVAAAHYALFDVEDGVLLQTNCFNPAGLCLPWAANGSLLEADSAAILHVYHYSK
jgi:hypothetical protein